MSRCNIVLLDSYPDLRTKRRLGQLSSVLGRDLNVYVDTTRATSNATNIRNYAYYPLSRLRVFQILRANFIYFTGSRIPVFFFPFLLFARLLGAKLLCEISDLPLSRDIGPAGIINQNIQLALWKFFLNLLTKNFIVTSEGFLAACSKKSRVYISSNCNPYSGSHNFRRFADDGIQYTFVYAGFIRYLDQLRLLCEYCIKHRLYFAIYGSPLDAYHKLVDSCPCSRGDFEQYIRYKGQFSEQDLPVIYSSARFVYSVYDEKSLNCRLALPNKLYEASFYMKPILVSSGTYLSSVVSSSGLGYGLSSFDKQRFESELTSVLRVTHEFDPERFSNFYRSSLNSDGHILDFLKEVAVI